MCHARQRVPGTVGEPSVDESDPGWRLKPWGSISQSQASLRSISQTRRGGSGRGLILSGKRRLLGITQIPAGDRGPFWIVTAAIRGLGTGWGPWQSLPSECPPSTPVCSRLLLDDAGALYRDRGGTLAGSKH
jgi:hypothetical protein